jgi:hypothetical protein
MPVGSHDALHVTEVRPVRAFETNGRLELEVAFSDGLKKVVDIKPLLTGVRRRLLYPDQFSRARVETGAVVWPGERLRRDQAHITDLSIDTCTLHALDPIES